MDVLAQQGGQLTHAITIQLCLCLVHLAIHMDAAAWPSPVEDLCRYLFQQQTPGRRNLLLEFLTLFPEEATNAGSSGLVRPSVRPSVRAAFSLSPLSLLFRASPAKRRPCCWRAAVSRCWASWKE